MSDDDKDDPPLLLGFVDQVKPGSSRLRRRYFPSKVGGLPVRSPGCLSRAAAFLTFSQAWLAPEPLPSAEQLHCPHTGQPLKFLLQASRRAWQAELASHFP